MMLTKAPIVVAVLLAASLAGADEPEAGSRAASALESPGSATPHPQIDLSNLKPAPRPGTWHGGSLLTLEPANEEPQTFSEAAAACKESFFTMLRLTPNWVSESFQVIAAAVGIVIAVQWFRREMI